jgi:hypothetical protein
MTAPSFNFQQPQADHLATDRSVGESLMLKKYCVVVAMIVLAVCVTPLVADAAKAPSYAPTLKTSMEGVSSASPETPYVVSGCGYNASYGGVTVVVHSPEAVAFAGQVPVGGCISLNNFATQGPGTYTLDAWQHVRNRDVVVASTSFTTH